MLCSVVVLVGVVVFGIGLLLFVFGVLICSDSLLIGRCLIVLFILNFVLVYC